MCGDLTERNSTQRKHRLPQASFHTPLEKRVTLQSHMRNHGDKQRDRSHCIRSQFVSLYRDIHTLSRPLHSALRLAKASASLGDIRISTAIGDTPNYESPKKEGGKSSFHICDATKGLLGWMCIRGKKTSHQTCGFPKGRNYRRLS